MDSGLYVFSVGDPIRFKVGMGCPYHRGVIVGEGDKYDSYQTYQIQIKDKGFEDKRKQNGGYLEWDISYFHYDRPAITFVVTDVITLG